MVWGMIPERESVAGRRMVGATDVRKSSDPFTHGRLHCSWPASQPSSYHSDPKLRLTAWSNKARGLGLHPRRQMCYWRGERMEPEMLASWHHLAQVPLPPREGEEKQRESVQSQQAQLLFLAWPHNCRTAEARTSTCDHQAPKLHRTVLLLCSPLFPFSQK